MMQDFGLYFGLGWQHIINIEALDHILFIIALTSLYEIKEGRKVLILITAFTIGHSITLALSTLNTIHISIKWVEFIIPLTIVITAISNLFYKEQANRRIIRLNYWFALFFGLIHGLGFAAGLRSLLDKNESMFGPLLGFNLGLEAGQIVIVISILLLSYILLNVINIPRQKWIIFLSAAVFSLALKMTIERWPLF